MVQEASMMAVLVLVAELPTRLSI